MFDQGQTHGTHGKHGKRMATLHALDVCGLLKGSIGFFEPVVGARVGRPGGKNTCTHVHVHMYPPSMDKIACTPVPTEHVRL